MELYIAKSVINLYYLPVLENVNYKKLAMADTSSEFWLQIFIILLNTIVRFLQNYSYYYYYH